MFSQLHFAPRTALSSVAALLFTAILVAAAVPVIPVA
jgi:hypothetical protein